MKKSLIAILALTASLNAASVAVVNGENIDDSMFGPDPAALLNSLTPEQKKALVDEVIDRKLILNEAKKAKVEDMKEYKILKQIAEENIAIQLWEKQQFEATKISEKDAKDFYDKNKNRFASPAQVKAKHILVQEKSEADSILKELSGLKGDALKTKFAELAKAKSIDKGSAAMGGELGWFPKSQMVPEFADAAFALKNGDVSKTPVKSNFGYHIILKEDSRAQSTMSFDKVKDIITNNLKAEKLQGEMAKKLENLRKNAKIEYK